jgi:nitric oxide reductase NorD protein
MSDSDHRPLDAWALHQRLDALVHPVLTTRRSVAAASRALSDLDRASQERFLASLDLISRTSAEMAYNFCLFAPPALRMLGEAQWDPWVARLMDTYDQGGVLPVINAMHGVGEYAARLARSDAAVGLEELAGVLERFLLGLSGRPLKVAAGEQTYTDTESVFLPPVIGTFGDQVDNHRLYKATVVHLWAQTWFGTWRRGLSDLVRRFPDAGRALRLFHALETLRLDACVARELPGIWRDMLRLRDLDRGRSASGAWQEAARRLRERDATVEDSRALLGELYDRVQVPPPACYQGELMPERAEQIIAQRIPREQKALARALARLAADVRAEQPEAVQEDLPQRLSAVRREQESGAVRVEIRLDGQALNPPPDVQQLLVSVLQDLGEIPPDYLVPAGDGAYRRGPEDSSKDAPPECRPSDAYLYPEWDQGRQRYRKDWCVLRERDVHPRWDDFASDTLSKHGGLLKHLRRTFEALRGEDKVLRRQPHGDDVDIDALVEAYADRRVGLEGTASPFLKRQRVERDIAVMFLVDMSGSTKGWINDIERESLILLCEALESLGDRYAIFGFSGFTHTRCEVFPIKRIDERYSDQVRARVSGIVPQDYTRMGVAIRHLSRLLGQVEARTRLLVTLSDGRPDDQDGYRGTYGIEDTRRALLEARYQGIHPFCITIDDEAMEYLPHMYGPASFTVVSDVRKLPYKVSDIYRRITA